MSTKRIELEKTSSIGKQLMWEAIIDGNSITYRYGQRDGKIQEVDIIIAKGKNVGRSNETTPAEQAILEAETKALKKIDNGYQLVSGEIGEHKTKMAVSNACPKVMLARQWTDYEDRIDEDETIFCQPKLDGVRVVVNTSNGKLYSRTRKQFSMLPHLEHEATQLGTDVWLDGELYSSDLSFEEIISITRNKKKVHEDCHKIKIHLFDAVLDASFEERFGLLESLNMTPHIGVIETCQIAKSDVDNHHDKYVQSGHEGIMIRLTGKGYESGRSYQLYKYKKFHDDEFTIVGFKSQKNNANKLGAIELVGENGEKFYATPKMSLERRQEIWDNQNSYLGRAASVKYQELTTKGVPRFGNVLEIRDYE